MSRAVLVTLGLTILASWRAVFRSAIEAAPPGCRVAIPLSAVEVFVAVGTKPRPDRIARGASAVSGHWINAGAFW